MGEARIEGRSSWMGDPRPCLSPHTSLLPQPFPMLRSLARNVPGLQEVKGKRNHQSRKEIGNKIIGDVHSLGVLARQLQVAAMEGGSLAAALL